MKEFWLHDLGAQGSEVLSIVEVLKLHVSVVALYGFGG